MRKLALALTGAAAAVLMVGTAWAGTLSSSKAAVTQGDLVGLGVEACDVAGPEPGACIGGGGTDDTGFITVMTTFLRTPNAKDLAFDVALQCALVTFTKAVAKGSGKDGGSGKADAEGRISVRVKVTEVDNDGDPTGAPVRYALPDNDGANVLGTDAPAPAMGPEGVTYCHRFQELEVSFENLVCIFDESEDPDDECIIAVSLLLETLNAHAFNFVMPDVSSGPKMIEVQARATADANVFDVLSSARGEAFVGMGSTLVETLRLLKSYDPTDGPNPDFTDLQ